MVFGIEHIGRFFDWLSNLLNSASILIGVVTFFLIFVALNIIFLYGYNKAITVIPNLERKIRYFISKIEDWLE